MDLPAIEAVVFVALLQLFGFLVLGIVSFLHLRELADVRRDMRGLREQNTAMLKIIGQEVRETSAPRDAVVSGRLVPTHIYDPYAGPQPAVPSVVLPPQSRQRQQQQQHPQYEHHSGFTSERGMWDVGGPGNNSIGRF